MLYIFRILQHFATKLCDFTNFKVLLNFSLFRSRIVYYLEFQFCGKFVNLYTNRRILVCLRYRQDEEEKDNCGVSNVKKTV